MPIRIARAVWTLPPLILVFSGGLPSRVDAQAPPGIRHGLFASRPMPGVSPNTRAPEYQLNSVHDRVTRRTRVSMQSFQRSERVAGGSFMSFSVSVTYPGHTLVVSPDSVDLEFVSFGPLLRGWPFGRPRPLHAVLDDSVSFVFPSIEYQRTPTHFGDSRRTEVLLFRIPSGHMAALASAGQLSLKVGRFTIKLDQRGLEPLRALSRQLGSSPE